MQNNLTGITNPQYQQSSLQQTEPISQIEQNKKEYKSRVRPAPIESIQNNHNQCLQDLAINAKQVPSYNASPQIPSYKFSRKNSMGTKNWGQGRNFQSNNTQIEQESPLKRMFFKTNQLFTSQVIEPSHFNKQTQNEVGAQQPWKAKNTIDKAINYNEDNNRRGNRVLATSLVFPVEKKNSINKQNYPNKFNLLQKTNNIIYGQTQGLFDSPLKQKKNNLVQQLRSDENHETSGMLQNFKKIKSTSAQKQEIMSPVIIPKKLMKMKKNETKEPSSMFRLMEVQDKNPISLNELNIDSFEKYDKIGKGAFGDVFLARQKKTGFICALKTLSKKRIKELNLEQQVMREIKIQSYMNHRHITSLYGIFDDKDKIYLILEYMPDGSIPRNKKKIKEEEAAFFVKQVCQGIIALHQQRIIHRDIKPQNLLTNDGYIKIADFGCAVVTSTNRDTVVGCFSYISPEQFVNRPYDDKIDVWSIGILAYQLLYGVPPFEQQLMKIRKNQNSRGTGDTQVSNQGYQFPNLRFPQKPQISEDAKKFIRNCLSQQPEERMQVKEALRHRFVKKSDEWQKELLKNSCLQR